MPEPPKQNQKTVKDESEISKKDVANLIKKILYKYQAGKNKEVLPGCFIEKKSFLKVIEELLDQKVKCFILDKRGESIRKVKIPQDSAFIIGDHDGLPKKEMKRLKGALTQVSIGPKTYFASQTVAVVNNELDFRGI